MRDGNITYLLQNHAVCNVIGFRSDYEGWKQLQFDEICNLS